MIIVSSLEIVDPSSSHPLLICSLIILLNLTQIKHNSFSLLSKIFVSLRKSYERQYWFNVCESFSQSSYFNWKRSNGWRCSKCRQNTIKFTRNQILIGWRNKTSKNSSDSNYHNQMVKSLLWFVFALKFSTFLCYFCNAKTIGVSGHSL